MGLTEVNLAEISLLPNFVELKSAMMGRRFLFNCLANEGFTNICGEADSARFIVGISWVVRGECLILKNVFWDLSGAFFGVVRILAISTLRRGSYWK